MTVLLLTLLACAPKHIDPQPGYIAPNGPVVGNIGEHTVTQAVIDAEMDQLSPEVVMQLEMMGQMDQMVEQVLVKEALYLAALKANVVEDEDVQLQIAVQTRNIMIEAHIRQIAEEGLTDERVEAWYAENADEFQTHQARASHILLEDEEQAQAILDELNAGARFSDLAQTRSIDPSAGENGGDLGWFHATQMIPEFSEAVFAGEAGDTLGPIQSQYGWHVIFVEAFRDTIPLDEVREEINAIVQEEIINDYITSMAPTSEDTTEMAQPPADPTAVEETVEAPEGAPEEAGPEEGTSEAGPEEGASEEAGPEEGASE